MLTPSDIPVTASVATVLIGDREMSLMWQLLYRKSTPCVLIDWTRRE